jgi:hypothetical protein
VENLDKSLQYIPLSRLRHAAAPTLARRKDLLLRCDYSAMALEYNLDTSDHLVALALATSQTHDHRHIANEVEF